MTVPVYVHGSQNPQCEGHHNGRVFFNASIPGENRFYIGIEQQDNTYRLMAGAAQGIAIGSEFAVYADHIESQSNRPLCTMRVTATEDIRATLEPESHVLPFMLPNPAYARQVRCGSGNEIRVHFTPALRNVVGVDAVRRAALDTREADIGFLVTAADNAEFLVDVVARDDCNIALFTTAHTLVKDLGCGRLPHAVPAQAEDISHVLRSAARWNWHLNHTNHTSLIGPVFLEFTRLEQVNDEFDDHDMPIMKPVGENMNRTGVIDMIVNPDQFFGLKIVNGTNRDLYPYLFYFDVSGQSIGELGWHPFLLPSVIDFLQSLIILDQLAETELTRRYDLGLAFPLVMDRAARYPSRFIWRTRRLTSAS